MYRLLIMAGALALAACGQSAHETGETHAESQTPETRAAASAQKPEPVSTQTRLDAALAAQPAEARERYGWRHPRETLTFFGIEPGMTVIEALPGGGWYSKILLDYLGGEGHLIGADYAQEMWPLFGFFSDEYIEGKKTWVTDWTEDARGWMDDDSAEVSAFVFGSMPERFRGQADAVLFIRAMHNLNRFESKGGFLSAALADAFAALKPGGVLGVVQHHARDGMSDEFADGSKGYLKKDALIAAIEAAGFRFEDASDINANPADQPTEDDIVWRLPPTLLTSRDNPELAESLRAIGESNRMTLRFRKP